MRVGIVGAMPQEVALLQTDLENVRRQTRGNREYLEGNLYGKETVLVFSRWGKVAAASTVTTLIEVFGVELVLVTGVAGAVDPALRTGDVVIGSMFVQHDLDPRPLFRRFEVPLLDRVAFETPPTISALARRSAEIYLQGHEDISYDTLRRFGLTAPRVHEGLIASGDQFIANPDARDRVRTSLIRAGLPSPLCVEMEGAAAAQVCYEHRLPFIVMRTISDKADQSAAVDFVSFVDEIAAYITRGIVKGLVTVI